MGTVTVTPANGYSRRGMSGYRAVGVAAAPAYDYAALYTALGVPGWVLHGGAGRSGFFEDSAGTVACTTDNVSPVGRVVDLSGTARHGLQVTTGNKPVYRVAGGIRSFRYTSDAIIFLDPAIATYLTTAFTHIAVYKALAATAGTNGSATITAFRNGAGDPGGYFAVRNPEGTNIVEAAANAGFNTSTATSNGTTSPTIVVFERTGLGAGQSTLTTYNLDGTLKQSVTGTHDGNPGNALVIGYAGSQAAGLICPFNMYAAAALSAGQKSDVLADIVSSLAGWNP